MTGMRIPFRLVDVFTDRPLTGNQLCVVPEPTELTTETMQALAREIGFSETTFVTSVEPGRYGLRIFTPFNEMPFAGHPTLGTAFVMVSEGRVSSPVVQVVAAGDVEVEVDVARDGRSGVARMRQLPPEFGPEVDDRPRLIRALGLGAQDLHPSLPPQLVSTGFGQLVVPVASQEALSRAAPSARPLAEILEPLGTDGCYVAFVEGEQARARFFWPALTVEEDAATGSAAGPLGAYLAERGALSQGHVTITQGVEMGRPSTLVVDVVREPEGWVVFVGGGVVRVGSGDFELPD